MRLGRFIVDTHVHSQRFAVGKEFAERFHAGGDLDSRRREPLLTTRID